jgi:hypothetical protein
MDVKSIIKDLINEKLNEGRDLWYITVDGSEHNQWGTGGIIKSKNEIQKFAKKVKKEYKDEFGVEPDISIYRAEPKRIKEFGL